MITIINCQTQLYISYIIISEMLLCNWMNHLRKWICISCFKDILLISLYINLYAMLFKWITRTSTYICILFTFWKHNIIDDYCLLQCDMWSVHLHENLKYLSIIPVYIIQSRSSANEFCMKLKQNMTMHISHDIFWQASGGKMLNYNI